MNETKCVLEVCIDLICLSFAGTYY